MCRCENQPSNLALSLVVFRTSRLPVIYVFGKQPVDVPDCAAVFDGFFSKDKSQKVILMYDVIYAHCIGKKGTPETCQGWSTGLDVPTRSR